MKPGNIQLSWKCAKSSRIFFLRDERMGVVVHPFLHSGAVFYLENF